ncbi:uncharacterized protein METZ01_LOCUS395604, partial [marine metagenome]
MNIKIKNLLLGTMMVLIGTFFQSNVLAHADHDKDAIIIKMANIMISLEHFPTSGDQKTLQSVMDSNSSTEQEKIIANAIMNIQHQATAEDQQKLQKIIDGTAPTSTVSTLA